MAGHHKPDSTRASDAAHKQRTAKTAVPEMERAQGSPDPLRLQRAIADPRRASPAAILALQRTHGNRAVQRLLAQRARRRPDSTEPRPAIQPKLMVGPAGDHFEQEADRVAEQVVRRPDPGPVGPVQRQEDDDRFQMKPLAASITPVVRRQEEEEEELAQPKRLIQRQEEPEEEDLAQAKPAVPPASADGAFEAGGDVESRVASLRGGGRPMPGETRSYMEPRFGADFSGVRIHTGAAADELNKELGAQAFTHGADIYFADGGYDPDSSRGRRLLAHELTHVIQQGGRQDQEAQAKPGLWRSVIQRFLGRGPKVSKTGGHAMTEAEQGLASTGDVIPSAKQLEEFRNRAVQQQLTEGPGFWHEDPEDMEAALKEQVDVNALMLLGDMGFSTDPKAEPISRPKPQAVAGDPATLQADAEQRGAQALAEANNIVGQAKAKADDVKKQHAPSQEEMQFRKAASGGTKEAVKRAQRGEAGAHRSTELAEGQLADTVKLVDTLLFDIRLNGQSLNRAIEAGNTMEAQSLVGLSLGMAGTAEGRVREARKKLDGMGATAELESAQARGKMPDKTWASAERSASDAALALEQSKYKIIRYYEYLQMDKETIEALVHSKAQEVIQAYDSDVAARIVASGRARGGAKSKSGPLSDSQAEMLAAEGKERGLEANVKSGTGFGTVAEALEPPEAEEAAEEPKGNKYLDPSLREGKWAGFKKAMGRAGAAAGAGLRGGLQTAGKKLSSPFRAIHRAWTRRGGKGAQIKKIRLVQGLELMSKFHVAAEERFAYAEKSIFEAMQLHDKSLMTYDQIDAAKRAAEQGGDSGGLDAAVVAAGDSWKDVLKIAMDRDTLQKYRDDVKEESGKYAKYGDRAIGTGKKIGYAALGLLAGTGLKLLTGGMLRYEKKEVAAGYGMTLERKTIVDDVKKAIADYKEASQLRGMGGRRGATAYAVLQVVSTALGLLKPVASSLALFTLAFPPVSAGFAAAALYTTIAKAAIDLALLIWSAAASAQTMDPRSRSKLRGRIAQHGLAFGEGAATAGAAGLLAGVSGNVGTFEGKSAGFDTSQQTAGAPDWMNWSQNIGGKEIYYAKQGLNVGLKQSLPLAYTLSGTVATGVNDENIRHMKMMQDEQAAQTAELLATTTPNDARDKTRDAKDKMSRHNASIASLIARAESALREKEAKKGGKDGSGASDVLAELPAVSAATGQVNEATQSMPDDPGQ